MSGWFYWYTIAFTGKHTLTAFAMTAIPSWSLHDTGIIYSLHSIESYVILRDIFEWKPHFHQPSRRNYFASYIPGIFWMIRIECQSLLLSERFRPYTYMGYWSDEYNWSIRRIQLTIYLCNMLYKLIFPNSFTRCNAQYIESILVFWVLLVFHRV